MCHLRSARTRAKYIHHCSYAFHESEPVTRRRTQTKTKSLPPLIIIVPLYHTNMSCLKSVSSWLILALVAILGLAGHSHAFAMPKISSSAATTHAVTRTPSLLSMGLLEDVGGFLKRFTTKATASHILIRGGAEAEFKLLDLKADIADSPVKFAEMAARYSECPTAASGGSLGEFGPGAMVKEFDQVVFNEKVGQVHGPVKTQFGYHLIYISDRME